MGHKILLADDSITIQKVIELTFTDEDFELHTVGNGQKAIDEVRTVKPDIVLCDIIMPEKSGYEVCEHIKTSDDLKHIPVLLLTGAFEPFDQERAKKAGCDGFLAKPFEPQTLISKVKELLSAPAQAPSPAVPASEAAAPAPPGQFVPETPTVTPGTPAPPAASPPVPDPEGATVMMSPDMPGTGGGAGGFPPAASPPVPEPSAPVAPAPESPPMTPEPSAPEGAGFQENFAVEAGERELSVDSDDRTMFLGQEPGGGGGSSDDIWNEVQGTPSEPAPPASPAPPVVPSEDEESQTVMMSAPIVPEPPKAPPTPPTPEVPSATPVMDEPPGFVTPPPDPIASNEASGPEDVPSDGFTELPSGDGGDNPWVIPGPDEVAPAPPPAQPQQPVSAGQSGETAGDDSTIGGSESAEPELTPLGDFGGFDDFSADQQAPPGVTAGPVDAVPAAPTPPSPTPTPDPIPPRAPLGASAPAEPASPAMPTIPTIDDEPFAELAPTVPPSGGLPETPAGSDEGSAQGVSSAGSSDGDGFSPAGIEGKDMDELADKIAKKVLSQLSEKVIQEIAWEVVPDLAEALIQKEIAEIKAKIPK